MYKSMEQLLVTEFICLYDKLWRGKLRLQINNAICERDTGFEKMP